VICLGDDLGEREAEAINKLLDLAKYSILAILVGAGVVGSGVLGI